VDDGTTDRVRAWRFRHAPGVPQGATVTAEVSPRTQHVRDLQMLATSVDAR
jgi:hypothetical protein